ncbi:MAG: hypothetical protein AABW80_00330 [Nanoarchaeota archaeon]
MNESRGVVFVEAIDDGRIVRVPEEYARQEGLPIIRRSEPEFKPAIRVDIKLDPARREKRGILSFEDFRKPLKSASQVEKELLDNFPWLVAKKRKERNMTRRQLAKALSLDEYEVMMFERGILLKDDFILINKLQQYFQINLRKDGKDFGENMRDKLTVKKDAGSDKNKGKIEDFKKVSGSDIEIFEP